MFGSHEGAADGGVWPAQSGAVGEVAAGPMFAGVVAGQRRVVGPVAGSGEAGLESGAQAVEMGRSWLRTGGSGLVDDEFLRVLEGVDGDVHGVASEQLGGSLPGELLGEGMDGR